jgi:hypothetical protein
MISFTPRPPYPQGKGTHWTGGWVGPRAVLDVVVKRKNSQPPPEIDSQNPGRPTRPVIEIPHKMEMYMSQLRAWEVRSWVSKSVMLRTVCAQFRRLLQNAIVEKEYSVGIRRIPKCVFLSLLFSWPIGLGAHLLRMRVCSTRDHSARSQKLFLCIL